MKSKAILLILCLGAICAALILRHFHKSETPAPEMASGSFPKTDIILVSIDTLRADHLSCYGYGRKTSPCIDTFSQEAAQFENAMTQSPVTAPAHMSIFTAMTPMVHQVKNHQPDGTYCRLSADILTLPVMLKKNGYITAGFVGGGNISGDLGFDKGFDLYSSNIIWEDMYDNPGQMNEVRRWIERSKEKERPLFLFLHNYICHDPYISAPEIFRLQFLDKRVAELPTGPEDMKGAEDTQEVGHSMWKELDMSKPEHLKYFANKREMFWKNVDLHNPDHREHIVSLYDGCVSYADYIFGEIIKALKECGKYDNSIIILLSDHGEEFFEHQTYLHRYLFVETMHVPLLIRFPQGAFGGMKIQTHVRTLDLMPTLLDFLGIPLETFVQGLSFMPLLKADGDYNPRMLSYSEPLRNTRFQEGSFVYTDAPAPGGNEWLFDTSNDPRELTNLAESQREVFLQMKEQADRIREEDKTIQRAYNRGDAAMFKADKKIQEQLRALGYLQ